MIRKNIGCVATALLLLWLPYSRAGTGVCSNPNGTNQYLFSGQYTVTDGSKNTSGSIFNNAYHWNLGGQYSRTCDCTTGDAAYNNPTYFKAVMPNAYYSTVSGIPWYTTTSPYLVYSASVWIGSNRASYVQAPFTDESNNAGSMGADQCNGHVYTHANTGALGYLSFMIIKPFTGYANISGTAVRIYSTMMPGRYSSTPESTVNMSIQVAVPQTCTLQAGQTVSVDLGDLAQANFVSGGIGNPPTGSIPVTKTFPVQCNGGVDSSASLTIRLQGQPASGYTDALASSNPDVGVKVTDSRNNVLKVNDLTSYIPFTLSNGAANVTIKVFPISTTGKAPTVGTFTSLAYLRVDFA